MMTIDDVRRQLKDLRPSRVSEATGLHTNSIRDIRDNPEANPTYKTLKAISDYLESRA
jgi:hypothetical protein